MPAKDICIRKIYKTLIRRLVFGFFESSGERVVSLIRLARIRLSSRAGSGP
jgi:hypothetical protein